MLAAVLPVADDLLLLAMTIWLEARGEPFEGQVAVGWVIVNRNQRSADPGVGDVVWAPYQFSAWNSDARARAELQEVMVARSPVWAACVRAAAAVLFEFVPDPTGGATFYLNPAVTRAQRGGSLPGWYDPAKVTARIGAHEFLRA